MSDDFSLNKVPMICPHCNRIFPAGAKFCNTCGGPLEFDFSRLDLGSAEEPPAPQPQPLSDQTRVFHIDTEQMDAPVQPPVQAPSQPVPQPRFDPETGLPLGQPAQGNPPPPPPYFGAPQPAPQPEPTPKKRRAGLIAGITAAVVVVAALAIVLVTTKCFGLLDKDGAAESDKLTDEQVLSESQAAYDDGSYAKAVALLEEAIAGGKTDDPAFYQLLGKSYEAQNNHRAAAQAYAAGFEATGDETLKADALRLYKLARDWQNAAKLDPDDPEVQAALQAQENTGDEPAGEPANEPAEAEPEPEAEPELTLFEQAQAAFDAGDYETAFDLAEQAVSEEPERVEAWVLLGSCAMDLGDLEQAVICYRDGYAATGDETLKMQYIGVLYTLAAATPDDAQALSYYEEILDTAPDEVDAQDAADAILDAHTIHRYEVVAGDVTWTNAKSLAEAAGGHLATISDAEEFREITAMAAEQGLHVLWLGAEAEQLSDWDSDDFTWITGEPFNFTNWLDGEPNCDLDEEFYLGAYDVQGTWYFNDCPNDVSTYYAGKIGYVIEYEELDF